MNIGIVSPIDTALSKGDMIAGPNVQFFTV